MKRSIQEARGACDERLLALAHGMREEPVAVTARLDTFRPLFVGFDAEEALRYTKECADQAIGLIVYDTAPADRIIFGVILRALLVGLLTEGGG